MAGCVQVVCVSFVRFDTTPSLQILRAIGGCIHKNDVEYHGLYCVALYTIVLDWIGLDWIVLDWIGSDWIRLDCAGLDWIGLDGLDWIG